MLLLLLLASESEFTLLCEMFGSDELLFLDMDEVADALSLLEGGRTTLLSVVCIQSELEIACRTSSW